MFVYVERFILSGILFVVKKDLYAGCEAISNRIKNICFKTCRNEKKLINNFCYFSACIFV